MIQVENLSKWYGGLEALHDLGFTVPKGQVVGLLGPNGAGKTTAMRILTGFVAPTSGRARIGGMDVQEEPLECRRRVGYLPEGNPLYLDLRVTEALRFTAEMFGLRGAERDAAVRGAVESAGIGDRTRSLIGTLSKGYRQRVGLAQALLHKPDVLILDEPTSGLDPNQQEDMRELIRSLGRERTVMLSTHILPEVEAVCDRALIIHKGRLAADGSVEQIRAAAAGEAVAEVRVRAERAAAEAAFRGLDFVSHVAAHAADGDEGVIAVRLTLRGAADAARLEALAKVAHDRGLRLSGLRAETKSLEKVFAELTGDAAEATPVGEEAR
jgi:ABC-2 type transport system ATP-binding protein